jgi:hypothetical protein
MEREEGTEGGREAGREAVPFCRSSDYSATLLEGRKSLLSHGVCRDSSGGAN